MPRHFFRIGRLIKQINLPSTLLHGGPIVKTKKKEISVLNFLYVERPDTKRAKKERKSVLFFMSCVEKLVPLPHGCAAARCAIISLFYSDIFDVCGFYGLNLQNRIKSKYANKRIQRSGRI